MALAVLPRVHAQVRLHMALAGPDAALTRILHGLGVVFITDSDIGTGLLNPQITRWSDRGRTTICWVSFE